MITHIVLFRLKDRTAANIAKAGDVLRGLRGKVPVLRGLEVGVDVVRSERSFDVGLVAKFDSLDDLRAYQLHPAHLEVVKYMNSVRETSVAVDYESP